MSVRPRPSIRTFSVRMRCRTSFLVTERNALPNSEVRPANSSPSAPSTSALTASVASSRSCLPAICIAAASFSDAAALTAAYTSSR